MKKITFITLAMAACMSLTMCQKNAVKTSDEGLQTIKVNLEDTKVAIAQGDAKLTLSWQENDQLRVIGQTSEVYDIEAGFSAKCASFVGPYTGTGSRTVFYPGTYADEAALGARSYTNQVQDGVDTTAHLQFNAIATNLSSITELDLKASNPNVKLNQAVKFVVKLPAGVTTVDSLILQAPSALFYTTNAGAEKTDKLVLRFTNTDVSKKGQVLTAYMMMSWQSMNIPSGTEFTVKVIVPGQTEACCFSLKATTNQAYSWVGGKTFTFDMSSKVLGHTIKGSGTQADPYQLMDAYDLTQMEKLVASGTKKYFKLMADVDMKDITTWNPINQLEPFDIGIDFNGNNKTIKNFTCNAANDVYAGFIGVLNGKLYDLTFKDAVVTSTNKAAGIVCGYAGTGNYSGDLENVTVLNGNLTQNGSAHSGLIFGTSGKESICRNCHTSGYVTLSSKAPIANSGAATGGIAGHSKVATTFENCSSVCTISSCRLCAGIIGYAQATGTKINRCWAEVNLNVYKINGRNGENTGGIVGYLAGGSITNCYTKGKITITDQICGGIAGDVYSMTTIKNCWSSVELKAGRNAGGIAGRCSASSWTATSAAKILELEKCIYFGTKIDVAAATNGNGSSASIVGYTSLANVVSNSWRINDSKFTFVNTGNTLNFPADQPDGCSTWVKGTTPQVGKGSDPTKHLFPYWGKAAAADATVSSIATTLGWDTTIWDLSGSEPTLR